MFYAATLGMLEWDSFVEYVAIFSCKHFVQNNKKYTGQVKWDTSIVSYLAEWHIEMYRFLFPTGMCS